MQRVTSNLGFPVLSGKSYLVQILALLAEEASALFETGVFFCRRYVAPRALPPGVNEPVLF